MYCVFNVTTLNDPNSGNPIGWPLEKNYGYFCDQRDQGLYMLSNGVLNVVAIVVAYLAVVLYIGPLMMQNKKPLEIKNIIRMYNAAMILVNLYLVRRALRLVDYGRSFFNCKGVEFDLANTSEIAVMTELFLWSRVADFLDTLWFVLRKKQSHISFLHVFHHSYVPLVTYASTRLIAVVPNVMTFPMLNGVVHVIMYTYYALSTFPYLKPYLWWKRYLTGLQMLQFVSILIYNVFAFFYFDRVCGKSDTNGLIFAIVSAIIFLILFNSFYKRSYGTNQTNQKLSSNDAKKALTDQSSAAFIHHHHHHHHNNSNNIINHDHKLSLNDMRRLASRDQISKLEKAE